MPCVARLINRAWIETDLAQDALRDVLSVARLINRAWIETAMWNKACCVDSVSPGL